MNGLLESRRRKESPSKFLFHSNPQITLQDKYSEELTLTIDKPVAPNENFVFGKGYYKVDDVGKNTQLTEQ